MGILPDDFLENISYQERLELRKQVIRGRNGLKLVAVNDLDQRVVGFCDVGPNRGQDIEIDSELYGLYLLEEFKGAGVGRNLFAFIWDYLKIIQSKTMILWVLKENHRARGFYERMGGTLFSEKLSFIGNNQYPEVSYIWKIS